MRMNKISYLLFFFLLGLCIFQAFYYYPELPEKVARHFDLAGNPNAWCSKKFFIIFYFIITGGVAFLFLGISLFVSNIPVSLINLPNKEYWLSIENKEETFAYIEKQLLLFGTATLLLFLFTFHRTFQLHLGRIDKLEYLVPAILIYIVFSAIWSIDLFLRFRVRKLCTR